MLYIHNQNTLHTWPVKCRPFKMVREFCSNLIIAVYVLALALEELYCLIRNQMNFNPEAAVIVAADFVHMKLKAVLPKFWKFAHFPTRDNSILHQVYYNTPRD